MIEIRGKRTRGLGQASETIQAQLPGIVLEFPEVASCHHGTINVKLEYPLLIMAPDHRTKPIPWAYRGTPVVEVFDFLRLELEAPIGAVRRAAWLYISHGTAHRLNPRMHEILAPTIVDLPDECECILRIDRPKVQWPYAHQPQVAIVL